MGAIAGTNFTSSELVIAPATPATCDLAHEAGMTVHANFMMGFPYENKQNRQKTIDYASNLDSDNSGINGSRQV